MNHKPAYTKSAFTEHCPTRKKHKQVVTTKHQQVLQKEPLSYINQLLKTHRSVLKTYVSSYKQQTDLTKWYRLLQS